MSGARPGAAATATGALGRPLRQFTPATKAINESTAIAAMLQGRRLDGADPAPPPGRDGASPPTGAAQRWQNLAVALRLTPQFAQNGVAGIACKVIARRPNGAEPMESSILRAR